MSIVPKKNGESLNIREFASLAGCSTATVSRVFSGKPGVSTKKREQILELARHVGFSPNPIAQNLALQKSHVLGFLTADLLKPATVLFFRAFQQLVESAGYKTFIADAQNDPDRERQAVATMRLNRAEGMLVFPIHDGNTNSDLHHLLELKIARYPFVVMGHIPGYGFDCVTSEEESAAATIARHLLGLGHQRIAFVGADTANRCSVQRLAGVRRALAERGLELDASHVVEILPGWEGRMPALLQGPQAPTALITADTGVALQVLRPIAEAGLRIPQDISLASFGDEPWAQHIAPSLTTTRKNIMELVTKAAELLFLRMEDPSRAPQVRIVNQEIVVRESTAPPPA